MVLTTILLTIHYVFIFSLKHLVLVVHNPYRAFLQINHYRPVDKY